MFDMSTFSISGPDGDTSCTHEAKTNAFCKQCLGFASPKEEMDSRRATRATSETFPPREELSVTESDEQDSGNKLIRKNLQNRGSRLWQYVWRWLRKHRDDGGYGREDPAVASQTGGLVAMAATETNT